MHRACLVVCMRLPFIDSWLGRPWFRLFFSTCFLNFLLFLFVFFVLFFASLFFSFLFFCVPLSFSLALLTTGDGARHDCLEGKSVIANETTCELFKYLNMCGVPTHFLRRENESSFVARACTMVPIEFVMRRRATGLLARTFPKHPNIVLNEQESESDCL